MKRFIVTVKVVVGIVCILAAAIGTVHAGEANRISSSVRDTLADHGVDKLIFVKRYTYQSNHYYTDYINGCEYFGGNICVLNLKDGTETELVPSMKDGIFGRYDLSFDGTRIVFDWKRAIGEGFRIYEVGVDGTGLRQLTFPPDDEEARIQKYRHWEMDQWQGYELKYHHHTDDMHPCYLPDGGICFISSRCEFGILCDDPDVFTTTVLYRMDGDGKNMEKLTNSSVSEANPTITSDGRILYTRWEYIDKGSVVAKCLWAMRPDGGGSVEIFGNDVSYPPSMVHCREIPNRSNLFVFTGAPHCPQSGVGTVIRIDTSKDIRTREPMTYITPEVDVREEGGFHYRRNGRWEHGEDGPLYSDPYPLSQDLFLVSHNSDRHWAEIKAWDLYLIDSQGHKELIYDDPDISCWMPIPLRSRKTPPVLTTPSDPELAEKNLAVCVVTDVYHGLENVERGSIRYIRVNEQVPRPWAARRFWDGDIFDQQHAVLTLETHLGLKVQHGIVPVYEDGSAHFVVPADKNIFLQVLDENFMEVQRERTYVNYRPGEVRACIGCHERNKDVPASGNESILALQDPPHAPGPQPGELTGARPLYYPTDVQPILDKHCIKCHSEERPEADLILTGEMTEYFSRSYENLLDRDRRLMPIFSENGDKKHTADYIPALSMGSHASRLIDIVRRGCSGSSEKLSQEDMIRLTTWVDSNVQFYGSYYGRRNLKYEDHPNFRPVPKFAEAVSMKAPLKDEDR
jgi:hypothetical protein